MLKTSYLIVIMEYQDLMKTTFSWGDSENVVIFEDERLDVFAAGVSEPGAGSVRVALTREMLFNPVFVPGSEWSGESPWGAASS